MSTTRISRLGFKAAENGRFDIMKSIYRKVPHQVRAYMNRPGYQPEKQSPDSPGIEKTH